MVEFVHAVVNCLIVVDLHTVLCYHEPQILRPIESSDLTWQRGFTATKPILCGEAHADEIRDSIIELGCRIRCIFVETNTTERDTSEAVSSNRIRYVIGITLIVLGILILLNSLGIFRWFN